MWNAPLLPPLPCAKVKACCVVCVCMYVCMSDGEHWTSCCNGVAAVISENHAHDPTFAKSTYTLQKGVKVHFYLSTVLCDEDCSFCDFFRGKLRWFWHFFLFFPLQTVRREREQSIKNACVPSGRFPYTREREGKKYLESKRGLLLLLPSLFPEKAQHMSSPLLLAEKDMPHPISNIFPSSLLFWKGGKGKYRISVSRYFFFFWRRRRERKRRAQFLEMAGQMLQPPTQAKGFPQKNISFFP